MADQHGTGSRLASALIPPLQRWATTPLGLSDLRESHPDDVCALAEQLNTVLIAPPMDLHGPLSGVGVGEGAEFSKTKLGKGL